MNAGKEHRNIIITGFMGTGKSTVGRLLAARLGRPFLDMDEQIEAYFGKPIPEIFANDGEAAFRAAEAAICRQVADQTGLVLSTGGGALVNPANRDRLAQSGVIICLTATEDAILERVQQASNRPLLPGSADEQRQRIRDLLRPAPPSLRRDSPPGRHIGAHAGRDHRGDTRHAELNR
ncbi:MAG: AAA family ATPase [Caldilineaceae bacterium]|nr:AAA family ATPase [Caldilineaceae bacterium]